MLENKSNIFIIIGFLIVWSLIVSGLLTLITKVNLLYIFAITLVLFGLFTYLIFILLNNFIFNQEEEENEEEEQNDKKLQYYIERISVKTGQKLDLLNLDDIMYFQSNGDYVSIYSKEKVYLKEETMKYFESNLPPKQFIRIHRSYIVNVNFINSIENYKKNQFIVKLKNGYELKASLSGYKILKETLSL